MNQKEVTSHFDKIAPKYDSYKKRNLFFYYSTLKKQIKKLVPVKSNVLDWGCGTGEILKFISPALGVGFDPSREMINIAKSKYRKHKNLSFTTSLSDIQGSFDYIILIDVVEHLPDIPKELRKIGKFMDLGTKLIVSFVDTSWEWFPKILETFNLKMPEGPHRRINFQKFIEIAKKEKFKLISKSHFLSPFKIVVLSKR